MVLETNNLDNDSGYRSDGETYLELTFTSFIRLVPRHTFKPIWAVTLPTSISVVTETAVTNVV